MNRVYRSDLQGYVSRINKWLSEYGIKEQLELQSWEQGNQILFEKGSNTCSPVLPPGELRDWLSAFEKGVSVGLAKGEENECT